ncbi:MAG: glycosyltransferase family 4 protein [Planctomycetota bacterium]
MYRPEPLPLSFWFVNPFDDIPGEGLPPLRYWSLARVLAARGHDVTWWTSTWSHRRKAPRTTPFRIQDEEGFAVRLVAVRPYMKNVSLARLASHRDFGRTFERLANEAIAAGQLERPDLILASLPPLEGPEAAARLAKRLDANLVVDLMDIWPETFERLLPGPPWLRRILSPLFLGRMAARRRALLEGADAVSSSAHGFLDAIPEATAGDKPRHVCHLGAWVAEFPPPPRMIAEVPFPQSSPLPMAAVGLLSVAPSPAPLACIYSGTLEAGQDLDTLISAAGQLTAERVSAIIHVAGTGRMEPTLRKAAAGIRGSCTVQVHGLLDRGAYVRLLGQCDVGLVLVKPESLVAVPYKVCDYSAAGLAIVNSLPGELERFVTEYQAGVAYQCGNSQSLARAIAGLAANRPRLLEMRQGSRRLAEREFDREKTYSRFADWLEGISRAQPSVPLRP